jgi:hypothetical protein
MKAKVAGLVALVSFCLAAYAAIDFELSGEAGPQGPGATTTPEVTQGNGLLVAGSTVDARPGTHTIISSDALALAGTSASLTVNGRVVASSSGNTDDAAQMSLVETEAGGDFSRLTLAGPASTNSASFWTIAGTVANHNRLNFYRRLSSGSVGEADVVSVAGNGVVDLCLDASGCKTGLELPIVLRSATGSTSPVTVPCSSGETLLSGGCQVTTGFIRDSRANTTQESSLTEGALDTTWLCSSSSGGVITVYAICLKVQP